MCRATPFGRSTPRRESENGESVLMFPSGTIWDADAERVIDVLRFVALDNELIEDPDGLAISEDRL